MKFDLDRCAECGQLLTALPYKRNNPPWDYFIDANGKLDPSDPFRFCSDDCLYRALKRTLPELLPTDATVFELKDVIQRHIKNYRETWYAENTYRTAKDKEEALREEREFEEKIKPRPIPEELRYEHTHILGPSGSGKTTLIERLFLEDMSKPDPPAYIIIDPKGFTCERILRLANIPRDRLVYIDPTRRPPALNIFKPDIQADAKRDRDRILNQLIETFGYIFSTADARLTQRQSVPFSYVVRFVFWKNGDINTLMDVLSDTPKQRRFATEFAEFGKSDPGSMRFFEGDFYETEFNSTRQQIRTRLYEIISRPELMQMLAAPDNRLSLPQCLRERKIVLVNTAFSQLGMKNSTLLGRYMIAATLNAAFARPKEQWAPAYLVIDEFQDFADEEKTPEMLRLAREYRLGIVMAHQLMDDPRLKPIQTTISTNTSIKYAASPEAQDLAYVARDLRCEPDFLRQQEVRDGHVHFACFARNMNLTHPFIVRTPIGRISREPQISEAAYRRWLADNDARLAPAYATERPIAIQHAAEEQQHPEPTKKNQRPGSTEAW
jgi:GTPase SAR1 family protein